MHSGLDKEERKALFRVHLRSTLPGLFLLTRNHTPVGAIRTITNALLGAVGGQAFLARGMHEAVLVYVVDHCVLLERSSSMP